MMHHSLDCCDSNRGADKLFNNYQKNNELVYNLMINNPDKLIEILWTQESPFCIDTNCRCLMGEGDRRSSFSCSQCKNISKLKDFRKSELIFKIQCGINNGKTMIILPCDILKLFICYDLNKSITFHNLKMNQDMKFICSDPFTNRTLMMCAINKIFKDKKLPHILNFYTAFICGDKGYTILENPSIGSLDNLHKISEYHTKPENMCSPFLTKITKTIITQLVVTLNELSYINFSHGSPSIESLAFGSEHISYKYEGINIFGDITLKIVNLWKSSATFSNIRYFADDIKSELHLECNMLIPNIETVNINNCTYYKIGHNNINTLIAMKNLGMPILLASFDLYCFLVSLMCDQSFYMSVMKDNELHILWNSLWLNDDLICIEKLICDNHFLDIQINNFQTTMNMISNFWLNSDAIKHLLLLIKKK